MTTEPDAHGWSEVGEHFDAVPNDCFDVFARYYDAAFDSFMVCRFPGCVKVGERILWGEPFPNGEGRVDLLKHGYRPTHWRPIPLPPTAFLLSQPPFGTEPPTLSNSVPASPQALTDKPGSDTPPLSGTNSAVTA